MSRSARLPARPLVRDMLGGLCLGALALVVSILLVTPSLATGQPPHAGFWSLARLGASGLDLTDPADGAYELATVTLPPGERWCVSVALAYQIELDPASPPGQLSLWDERAGASATLLRLRWHPTSTGGYLEWDTLDLFRGLRRGLVLGPALTIVVHNLVPDDWRAPASAPLRLYIERRGPVRVQRLIVSPASGVELARRGPARLDLLAVVARQRTGTEDRFTVHVLGHNPGREPLEDVVLRLRNEQCPTTVIDPAEQRWERVERQLVTRFLLQHAASTPCVLLLEWGARGNSGVLPVTVPGGGR